MRHYLLTILAISTFIFLHNANAQVFDWVKLFNGAIQSEGISVDAEGNSFATGAFNGTATFGNIQLTFVSINNTVFITKYDLDGNCIWAKQVICDHGAVYSFGISVDSNRNCYVTGYFTGEATFGNTQLTSNNGSSTIFVTKYDENGNCIWAKQIVGTGGGYGNRISVDANGNSYVTGFFTGTTKFGNIQLTASGQSSNFFIAKFDINGDCIWARQSVNNDGGAVGKGISVDTKGSIYATGYFRHSVSFENVQLTSPNNNEEFFIVKYGTDGNFVWAKQAVNNNGIVIGAEISVDARGNSYVTGDFTSLVTFGNIQLSAPTYGYTNVFIAKYDSNGNCIWARQGIDNYGDASGFGISVDWKGNSYVTGRFTGTSTFGAIQLIAPDGYINVFIAKYDSNGNCIWAKQSMGNIMSGGNGIAVDVKDNCYVTGFTGAATFDNFQLIGSGGFIAKIVDSTEETYIEKSGIPHNFVLEQNHPNPFNPTTTINYLIPKTSFVSIKAYDVFGKEVVTLVNEIKTPGEHKISFNARCLSSGIYFYRMQAGGFVETKKLILLK